MGAPFKYLLFFNKSFLIFEIKIQLNIIVMNISSFYLLAVINIKQKKSRLLYVMRPPYIPFNVLIEFVTAVREIYHVLKFRLSILNIEP